MKKLQILVLIIVSITVIAGLTIRKSKPNVAARGKVIASGRSGIFDLKLNEASFFNFQNADSTGVIKGEVCILGNNDTFTGKMIKMVPRRFPKWFKFGCENGNIVEYKIITRGNNNEPMAQVIKINK